MASLVKDTFVVDQTAYIAKPKEELDMYFYLGILNSKLLFWYFQNINNEFDQLFPKIKVKEFNSLPIPETKFTQKQISEIVATILEEKSKNKNVNTSFEENQIDQLAYELYGLTEEEIRIVEGGDG